MSKTFLTILLVFYGLTSWSQEAEYFIVDNILYEGNKRTVERVINNELNILPGDTVYVNELDRVLLENEKRLLSTALFTLVDINVKNWRVSEQKADIKLTVQENWYIYPSIIFELADRNFNVWWTDQNRDFSRVNYGLSLDHINLTGNKDKLRVKIQGGYTPKYEARYEYPYISKRWGMSGEIFYSTNKEIGYITRENKTVFQKEDDERLLLQRFRTGMGVNYRPTVYQFHEARLEYHHNSIADIVATNYNPDYFLESATDLRFFLLTYNFTFDKRIFNLYPEGGYAVAVGVKKEGLGIFGDFDNLSVDLTYERHFSLGERWIWGGRVKGKMNVTRNKVAFANNTGLGYENDLIRGYELYVVDGPDWLLAKTSLRYRVYKTLRNLGRYMPIKQLKKMSFQMYLRANLDMGYVHEPTYTATNSLNNRYLVGYGPALDIIFWNTSLFSIEYSFNHLGENNLFLSSKFNF